MLAHNRSPILDHNPPCVAAVLEVVWPMTIRSAAHHCPSPWSASSFYRVITLTPPIRFRLAGLGRAPRHQPSRSTAAAMVRTRSSNAAIRRVYRANGVSGGFH
jgi:hypothetical protein